MSKISNNGIRVGFIGQGFVGGNIANDFEKRGYNIVRYSVDPKYINNKEKIKDCDVIFVAVPTPTTQKGFDLSIIENVLKLVGKGKIAVIKSTILPGSTKKLQKKFKNIFVLHSPEFLTEANAAYETAHPDRNIVGIPVSSKVFKEKANLVLSLLPKSPFELVCDSNEAELIKYGGNNFLALKVVFMNVLYDYAKKLGADWDNIASAMSFDPRIGKSHMKPYHKTSGKLGRGAGGHCFIKDLEALIEGYSSANKKDILGVKFLKSVRDKNNDLLLNSEKDWDILFEVYGKKILKKNN